MSVITHTLQSGQTLAVTNQASAGDLLVIGSLLVLLAIVVISFVVQVVYERTA